MRMKGATTVPWCAVAFLLVSLASLSLSMSPRPVLTNKTVPLGAGIKVILVGFNGDGGYGYSLGEETLERLLAESMSWYCPSSTEMKKQLAVNYTISYQVIKLPKNYLDEFSQNLGMAMRNADRKAANGGHLDRYSIEANNPEWDAYFDSLYRAAHAGQPHQGEPAIIFINADKREIQAVRDNSSPPHDEPSWSYHYTYNSGPMTSWVSKGRHVVVDISAGPVTFGPSDSGEGAIANISFPELSKFNAKIAKVTQSGGSRKHQPFTISNFVEIEAHMSTIIISAIRHVFLPDIHIAPIDADKVLVPIIVLRNHDRFNPWEQGHSLSIDFQKIKKEITSLALPDQEIVVLHDLHGLHEHKHLSMAVSKSKKTDSIYEMNVLGKYIVRTKPYMDSPTLLQGMRDAQDILTAGYMKGTDKIHLAQAFFTDTIPPPSPDATEAANNIHNNNNKHSAPNRPQGTRILPVYVLSLLGMEAELLLDHGSSTWAATQEAVIVLQTDVEQVSVSYFNDKTQLAVHPRNSTRAIIAGVSAALAGLNSATNLYSPIHKKVVTNYMWAHGHQPWGVFGGSDGLSQLHRELVVRNTVLNRLDTAVAAINNATNSFNQFIEDYLTDPFGVERDLDQSEDEEDDQSVRGFGVTKTLMEGLTREMAKLDQQLNSIGNLMRSYPGSAYTQSTSASLAATLYASYVRAQLAAAETELECCVLQHTPTHSHGYGETIFLVACLVALGAFSYWLYVKQKKKIA